ncbi:MAG: RIP metalloprotease RseP [Proteobacteria bacterium]|nr:RIP metalloprotease RseP [Pseudomonadota bacterium]MBU1710934.1 RIP metalloprotease RseP [Pseudomonadota bacterium]
MNSLISFILVLGLLIFVHEFGHFLFAKLFGVKVLKFSLGFGPKLLGTKYGETEYVISAFPLGGYVKMLGENPNEQMPEEEIDSDRSFSLKPVWKKFLIVAGGPAFNLFFAVFLFFMIFLFTGIPTPVDNTVVGAVSENSPAQEAGLQPGDIIQSINGNETVHWEDISVLIQQSDGAPIKLIIQRGKETLELEGKPTIQEVKNLFGETVGERLLLGISRTDEVEYEKVSIFKAFSAGLTQTWGFIYLTFMTIVKIIQNVVPASDIGGPIFIAQVAGQQLEAGWLNLFYFMGLLSVNLGILNLLPIPILDGGHLLFFSMEAVRRKPLSQRAQEMCQQVGLVLLGTLMVFVFYNDILRLFKG